MGEEFSLPEPVTEADDQVVSERQPAGPAGRITRERAYFFRHSGQEFALMKGWCGEVFPVTGITRVPLAPPILSGVVTLRGSLVLLLELSRIVGLKQKKRDPQGPALAVGIREKRLMAALEIDESLGFEPFVNLASRVPLQALEGTLGRISRGGASEALVLNVPYLFERFRQAMKSQYLPGTTSAHGSTETSQPERG